VTPDPASEAGAQPHDTLRSQRHGLHARLWDQSERATQRRVAQTNTP
jgi:hypothetical protein